MARARRALVPLMICRLWLLAGLVSLPALADPYDFQIHKLGSPITPTTYPAGSGSFVDQANGNFRAFARRLAAGISAVNLAPPETLGHSAFAITLELGVVSFLNGDGEALTTREFPSITPLQGALLLPSVHIRKGLPFSFEIGARAAWLEKSRMGAATVELKWALNEGWRYVPDIGVRAYITKLLNTRDFDVTSGGFDVGVGKQFPIAGMVTLTPYFGWNMGFTGATSNSVDFTPERTLADSDGIQDPTENLGFSIFTPVQAAENTHNRFYLGLRFIGGYFTLGLEFSYTLLGNFIDVDTTRRIEVGSVLAFNSMIGFDF